jgi:K+-transporting ATPase ATPase C chain
MKQTLITATLYTLITAVVLGLGYPMLMLGIAHTFFRSQADGQLIASEGKLIGSRLIGQPFTGPNYFHSRPSSAGTGYDAANSSGSNLGASSKALVDRVNQAAAAEKSSAPVPVDLVTTSGSGLDPDITVAAALYQAGRVAQARGLSEPAVRRLIAQDTEERQFGFFGEPRVPVLVLNRDLDALSAGHK